MQGSLQGFLLPISPILADSGIPAEDTSLVGSPPGFLYGARDPSRADHLKLGETALSPLARIAKLSGYAQAPFAPLFWFETPDKKQSESIWFNLLAEFKHPDFRELFCVPVDAAIAACKKAIAATRVVQRPSPSPSFAPTVTGETEALEYLLKCPVQFCGLPRRLGEIVGLAQKNPRALKRLHQLGLESKGWDARQPEYAFNYNTGGVLLKWFLASHYSWEDLGSFVGAELRVVFNILPDFSS